MVPIVQPKPGRFVVTLAQTKIEKIGQVARRDAEALAHQLSKFVSKQSADLKVKGVMLKLLRELTELTLRHSVIIAPIDRELSPAVCRARFGLR
jgi:hypothetical protein